MSFSARSFLRRIGKLFIWCCVFGIVVLCVFLALVWFYFLPKLPDVNSLRDFHLQTPLQVFTQDGKLITEFGEKRRIPLSFDEIPTQYINALLAAEDENFYQHSGVDPKALIRATVRMAQAGGKIQGGGSTITMQVARNYLLTLEKTFSRKFNEILLSLQIERELEKHEILEMYVNKMFMGHRAYGIEAASQVYYGKSARELTLAQHAMMAGLYKAPSKYNPLANPERATIRRDWILGRMLMLGYISQQAHNQAVRAPVTARFHRLQAETQASYVGEMVRQELFDNFGFEDVYTNGYRVFTTIDSRLQDAAQIAVQNGLMAYDRRHGFHSQYENIGTELTDREIERRLNRMPRLGSLEPAYVYSVDPTAQTALVHMRYSQQETIGFTDMAWMKPRINANRLGAAPEAISELIQPGDLVHVQQIIDEETQVARWALSQVPEVQGAIIALDPNNGATIALVGGFEYVHSKFNRATQAMRQPGSNFKPFIYSAALAKGYTAASVVNDAPVVFNDASLEGAWRPENSSGKFYGPTRLRVGLYRSRNLVSIRVLRDISTRSAISYATRFGFQKEQLPNNLSLALGSASLLPIDVASGYAVFANGGYRVYPYFIDRIEDKDGNLLYQAKPQTVCRDCEEQSLMTDIGDMLETIEDMNTDGEASTSAFDESVVKSVALVEDVIAEDLPRAERVMDEGINYIIHSILKDVITKGTGRRAKVLERTDLAGKTGTTNEQKDAWFSGYNDNLVATSWVGFDQPEHLGRNEFGSTAALPIWIDFMREALKDMPETERQEPSGLVKVRIDKDTGLLANGSENSIFEIFRSDFAPTKKAKARTSVEATNIDDDANGNSTANTGTKNTAEIPPESLF